MVLQPATPPPLLDALEDFFCSPGFTVSLGNFLATNTSKLQFVPIEETQPMENYGIFQEYQRLVDEQLTSFLTERGLTSQVVFDACQAAQASGDSQWMTCIDYLLASTEYESFMQLAYDHAQLSQYQPEEGADDDFELPSADEDEEAAAMIPLDAGGELEAEPAKPQKGAS